MLADETVDETKIRINKVVRKNLRVRLGDIVSVHQVGVMLDHNAPLRAGRAGAWGVYRPHAARRGSGARQRAQHVAHGLQAHGLLRLGAGGALHGCLCLLA